VGESVAARPAKDGNTDPALMIAKSPARILARGFLPFIAHLRRFLKSEKDSRNSRSETVERTKSSNPGRLS
jgi:hypothetical protein